MGLREFMNLDYSDDLLTEDKATGYGFLLRLKPVSRAEWSELDRVAGAPHDLNVERPLSRLR